MFSIVIPLYNKELSVKNTIESVLNQTLSNFEIVIVNDGSTDNSLQVVEQIVDSRIRIIHQKNQGVSVARNRGIEEAKYDWIAFLDADDLWKQNHLEEIVNMMNLYPNEKVFSTSFEYSDSRVISKLERNTDIFIIDNYFKDILKEYLIWTGVIVVNKLSLFAVGLFNSRLSRGEDLDLWERLSKNNNIVKSKLITATYRIEAENRSDLTFDLSKSRIYHYDFSTANTKEEKVYYKSIVIKVMRGLLKNGRFKSFITLKRKHGTYISYLDILKK